MKVRFKGENGSLGFKTGKEYEVKTLIRVDMILLVHEGVVCPYSSVESFLKNWEVVRL